MTQLKHALVFTLLLALASLQCVTPSGTPSTSLEGEGELSALVDGQPFSVKSFRKDDTTSTRAHACLYGSTELAIYAKSSSGAVLRMTIDTVKGIGMYPLSATSDLAYAEYSIAEKQFSTNTRFGGTLSVSSFDTVRGTIDATFSFTAISTDGQTVVISQGKITKVRLDHCIHV
jgi:hypothetical protein